MATKRYLANAAPAGVSPSTVSGWSSTSGAAFMALTPEPTGSATTASASETSSSSSYDRLMAYFISDQFLADGTFQGDFELVVGLRESSTSANFYPHVRIIITSADGSSNRVAYDSGSGSTGSEFPTTATARTITGTVSPISVVAGERIQLEVGYNARNTSTSTFTGYINFGSTGSTDLVSGNTGTTLTSRPGWIRFDHADVDSLFVAVPSVMPDEFMFFFGGI